MLIFSILIASLLATALATLTHERRKHGSRGFCDSVLLGGPTCQFNNEWMMKALETGNNVEVAWEKQHSDWVVEDKQKTLEHPISGLGSTVEYTIAARKLLLEVVVNKKVGTIFDAPCGDLTWVQKLWPDLRRSNVQYRGADISSKIIEYNNERFRGESSVDFVPFSWDITANIPPPVDLIIMRDVLFHLPVISAQRALAAVSLSGARYLLTTTFKTGTNTPPFNVCTLCSVDDKQKRIQEAFFHRINLFAPPFNLPQPIVFVDEPDEGRIFGLWKLPLSPIT